MQGEFIGVWSETVREIWDEIASQESAPNDLYCELYRELSVAMKIPPTPDQLADIIDDPVQSKQVFLSVRVDELAGERALVAFFEKTHEILEDFDGDTLSNPYFNLLTAFIKKFNLRYELRRPCVLSTTLTGVFASLMGDLRELTKQDIHLASLMNEFENAIRDLRIDCSDGRIKTCIQKQINLLEAIGRTYPGVTKTELGGICNQLKTWPHKAVMASIASLYGFASDYPGIRHGGTQASALRTIEMRDMVAMSILLIGFTPYLSDKINSEVVYWRS